MSRNKCKVIGFFIKYFAGLFISGAKLRQKLEIFVWMHVLQYVDVLLFLVRTGATDIRMTWKHDKLALDVHDPELEGSAKGE